MTKNWLSHLISLTSRCKSVLQINLKHLTLFSMHIKTFIIYFDMKNITFSFTEWKVTSVFSMKNTYVKMQMCYLQNTSHCKTESRKVQDFIIFPFNATDFLFVIFWLIFYVHVSFSVAVNHVQTDRALLNIKWAPLAQSHSVRCCIS